MPDFWGLTDTIDLQFQQCLSNMLHGVRLVDIAVASQQEAFFGGALINSGEFGGWIVAFIGVEPDADDGVFEGEGFHEGCHGVFCGVVTQEAED